MGAGRKINTMSQSWGTPRKYVDAVKAVFDGVIDLDPYSNEHSIVNAKHGFRLPEHDGLCESRKYKTIFVNPPHGKIKETDTTIKDWLCKCVTACYEYRCRGYSNYTRNHKYTSLEKACIY